MNENPNPEPPYPYPEDAPPEVTPDGPDMQHYRQDVDYSALTLPEIAYLLGQFGRTASKLDLVLEDAKKGRDARILLMVPEAGWPGVNEAARKLAGEKAALQDDGIKEIDAFIKEKKSELAYIRSNISSLEAMRRAFEWEIMDTLADALAAKHMAFLGQVMDTDLSDLSRVLVPEEDIFEKEKWSKESDNANADNDSQLPF